MIEVMGRWAALAPTSGQASWAPVQRMIGAAEEYGRGWKSRVLALAKEYGQSLGGLDDPLRVDMAWLKGSYEPAYSRWLGWALEQLGSAEAVWRVLDLPQAPTGVLELRTRTEEWITSADRLDIVVECDRKWRVVIETKLRSAEEYVDLSEQLSRYREGVKGRHPEAECVLIVLDAEKKGYHEFEVKHWLEICQRLRGELPALASGRKSRLVVAMILAFVGAVEQNLLGFPSLESTESAMRYPRVAAHIEKSMPIGDAMRDSRATSPNELLEEGAKSYPQAMYALSEFRKLVQDACVRAMEKNRDVLGSGLETGKVEPCAAPGKLGAGCFSGSVMWLGAKIPIPGGPEGELWNYVNWGGDPSLFAAVSITVGESAAFNLPQELDRSPDGREISLRRPIQPEELPRLESLLDEMNKKWAQIWQDAGGVKQFLGKH